MHFHNYEITSHSAIIIDYKYFLLPIYLMNLPATNLSLAYKKLTGSIHYTYNTHTIKHKITLN